MILPFMDNWISGSMGSAFFWMLIHSLWQGLLAAILAGLVILFTGKSPARIRYRWINFIFFLFLLSSVFTFFYYLGSESQPVPPPDAVSYQVPGVETDLLTVPEVTPVQVQNDLTGTVSRYLDEYTPLLVTVWLIFFLIRMVKMTTGLLYVQRLRYYKVDAVTAGWQKKFTELVERLEMRQEIRLLQSGLVKVPVAIGYLKPVILLPVGLLAGLPAEQVETILLHELAHIKRKDYLVNLIQNAAESVFFFNPGLLWISSLMREEREACCDDLVLSQTSHKQSYLEALISFQQAQLPSFSYSLALGGRRMQLLERVKRMVSHENKKLNNMEKFTLAAGMLALTAFSVMPEQNPARKIETVITVPDKDNLFPETVRMFQPEIITPVVEKKPPTITVRTFKPKVVDTVPSPKAPVKAEPPLKMKSVQINQHVTDSVSTKSIIAVLEDGHTLNVKKVNGKIVQLQLDNKTIPEAEYENHAGTIRQLEERSAERDRARKEENEKRKVDNQRRIDNQRRKSELMREHNDQQRERNDQQRERNLKQSDEKRRLMDEHHKQMQIDREHRMQLHKKQEELRKKQPRDPKNKSTLSFQDDNRQELDFKLSLVNKINAVNKIDLNTNMNVNQSMNITKQVNLTKQINLNNQINLNQKIDMNHKIDVNHKININSNINIINDCDIQVVEDPEPVTKAVVKPGSGKVTSLATPKKPSKLFQQKPAKLFQPKAGIQRS